MVMSLFKVLKSKRGVSTVEYAILAAVLIGIVATAVGLLGGKMETAFEAVGDKIVAEVNNT